ncbi:peptidoglycan DD-metalloendopeptidase family protein [Thalassotalea agarivorans]
MSSTFYRFVVSISLLAILGACARHEPAPVVGGFAATPLSQQVKNSITGTYYTVKKGETLYSIAWRADTDVRSLAKLNNISAPYHIYPGQKIFLSATSPQVSKNKGVTKAPSQNNKTVTKKSLAQNSKQAYGGDENAQKTNDNRTSSDRSFSQKIGEWQWPAKGKIIGTFSSAPQGNKGIDIAGSIGNDIYAAADGRVVYVGDALRGYGKLVIIKHNDDYLSAYAHNDKILVKEKQSVDAGDIIAKMGDTDAQRVMLHFEVRFRGKSVNPLKYLPRK